MLVENSKIIYATLISYFVSLRNYYDANYY